jgi:hypothetical protein
VSIEPSQYPALKTEITTDPKALGYAGKDISTQANLLNEVGLSQETVANHSATGLSLLASLNLTELSANPPNALAQWLLSMVASVTATEPVDPTATPFTTLRDELFPTQAYPTTHAALVALGQRPASRAEVLFGAGAIVDSHDITLAMGG